MSYWLTVSLSLVWLLDLVWMGLLNLFVYSVTRLADTRLISGTVQN